MLRIILILFSIIISSFHICATIYDENDISKLKLQVKNDSIRGKKGNVKIEKGNFTICAPKGYVFIDKEATEHLLVDYWGKSPKQVSNVLGALVPENRKIYHQVNIAYILTFEEVGYVTEDDIASIDSDKFLQNMQSSMYENSIFSTGNLNWRVVDWAWDPSYDKEKKVLSWCKLLEWTERGQKLQMLNSEARFLGRHGYALLTGMTSPEKQYILFGNEDKIKDCIVFEDGYRYEDFNSKTDVLAKWILGGTTGGGIFGKMTFHDFFEEYGLYFIIIGFGIIILIPIINRYRS